MVNGVDKLPRRKNHRLKNFDYGGYGYYFVTVCTRNRIRVLCNITASNDTFRSDGGVAPYGNVTIIPSEIGKKVIECWKNIAVLNENIEVDKFILMPNHIHGIVIIKNTEPIEQKENDFTFEITERRGRRSLQGLIRDFKSVTTRYYKKRFNIDFPLWQGSFYDEVIRDQEHYDNIWEYIEMNPMKWEEDEYYKS